MSIGRTSYSVSEQCLGLLTQQSYGPAVDGASYPGSSCRRNTDWFAITGLAASIGTIGDPYDNSMVESLNGTFKAELVTLHGPWRTQRQLETAIVEWIDWS